MALLYNLNRGKGEPLKWVDFYPYGDPDKPPPAAPPDLSQGIPPIFTAMKRAINGK